MEQIVRDTRIALTYEGTTGIQGLDLLGRKVLMNQGASLKRFTKLIHTFCLDQENNEEMKEYVQELQRLNKEWGGLTINIGAKAMKNRDEVSAASVDYLMYSGYLLMGYFWARMASVAAEKLKQAEGDTAFYTVKMQTADFYFKRVLPRSYGHAKMVEAGAESMMDMEASHFVF